MNCSLLLQRFYFVRFSYVHFVVDKSVDERKLSKVDYNAVSDFVQFSCFENVCVSAVCLKYCIKFTEINRNLRSQLSCHKI